MVAICEPKKLFTGGGAFALDLLLKLYVCAGTWKFGALFSKNGGGEDVPLNLLSLSWRSYSSGRNGGWILLLLGDVGSSPSPGPGKKSFPGPDPGRKKFSPSLLSCLSHYCFFYLDFVSLNL